MIEIEAKFKLNDELSRDDVMNALGAKLVGAVSEKHQIDTVFLLPEQVDSPIVPGSKIMRVRDVLEPQTGKHITSLMTLKVQQASKLASEEYEFSVEDGDMARRMLAAMGWRNVVTVDKLRLEATLDDYTVCIDEVAGLGLFIELEVLAEDTARIQDIQIAMQECLQELGLSGQLWDTPYDTSIRRMRHTDDGNMNSLRRV